MFMVAALYVDPKGPYPTIAGVDAWDEARDARTYAGPQPVVVHPPCGPWGTMRQFCGRPEDRPLALLAVEQVRQWGGVLEHPRASGLWPAAGLPLPGKPADEWGGWSIDVEQVSWGHVARKPTRLYLVRIDPALVAATRRTGGQPTHCIGRPSHVRIAAEGITWPCASLKATSSAQNRRTPIAFAEWLVMLARSTQEAT